MTDSDWIKIGVIGKAHGLRGHFFVSGIEKTLSCEYEYVFVGDTPSSTIKTKILDSKEHNGRTILKCELFASKTELENYVGKSLWVCRANIKINEEEEYLWHDMIGKSVVDVDNKLLGTIKDIYNFGASDIVELRDTENKILKISFIKQYFDMSFKSKDSTLRLVVSKDLFDEFWEK